MALLPILWEQESGRAEMTMPKEYIVRDDVINDIGELFTICRETLPNECGHHFIVENELQIHLDHVRSLPAADVVEVRHGRWEFEVYDRMKWCTKAICSSCKRTIANNADLTQDWGKRLFLKDNQFCAKCGAKMDAKYTNVPSKDGGQDDV